jgi:transcriptional regulator with XRE-family HTH domain
MAKVRLSLAQSAAVAANIRALRQARGWTQRQVSDLMEWGHPAVACRAEGRNSKRPQRVFTEREVRQLARIFGVTPEQLTMSTCAHCCRRKLNTDQGAATEF